MSVTISVQCHPFKDVDDDDEKEGRYFRSQPAVGNCI